MQLAHAYDGIRQQSSRLMTFSGQRCDPLTGLCNRQALDRNAGKLSDDAPPLWDAVLGGDL